ncbi:PREDICTED: disabled homolog 1-like isoform X8 [Branchiostoma belcheri]|uniref:Disabled homolog 1-like isoform X8 n=1 Tax=Branchiostoma belcheri TaxID=7741 RepID=A0A6P5A7N1_BRABE|nr:PREDICTED: disabled homolog 1-like isoform X8 [Branchiostoma belcheri]
MTSTVKKGKKEPLTDEEKVKQYEGDGMVFKGKVIGIDDVEAARGDKMCQDSMNKLKLAVKASGAHKQRITISVSLQGLKIIDLASGAINHRHPVHKISFIARDVTDNRAFGWVFSPGEGQHKFFAIKTEKQAEAVVLSIRDLFQTVYNVKKAEMDKKKQAQQDGTTDPTNGESYYQSVQSTKVKSPKKRRKGSPTNESSYDTSTGEPIYQDQLSSNHLNSNTLQLTACLPRVPTNKPVEQDGEAQPAAAEQNAGEAKAGAQVGNLLDLEEELQSLQTGIKDMDKLADLFAAQPNDPFSSPDSTANTPNRQQDLFGSPVAPVGNQPPANQAFANPAIQQQIDPFGGSFTAPPAQQPGFSQPPMGFNQPQAGFGQGFGTAPMVTTMQSPPMMAQPGFGSPAGFGASPFNSTTASVGLNTAAIASPPLNTAGQPLVRRPPPEEPKKSDAPDPFADLLDYAADQDKKQMAPPDEGGVEGTSDAFSAYFGSAVGIEADEEAESKPPPSGPPPPLPGADLAGPAPPPRPSANGMAPTPAPRQQNGPASSDPFGFGDSFGAAPPKPTRAAPPTAEADPFGLGSLNPTPAANPAPSNDPFGNEPFAPFDFGGGDSKNTAKQAPPKPDPFGLDPFTQQEPLYATVNKPPKNQ